MHLCNISVWYDNTEELAFTYRSSLRLGGGSNVSEAVTYARHCPKHATILVLQTTFLPGRNLFQWPSIEPIETFPRGCSEGVGTRHTTAWNLAQRLTSELIHNTRDQSK